MSDLVGNHIVGFPSRRLRFFAGGTKTGDPGQRKHLSTLKHFIKFKILSDSYDLAFIEERK